MIRRPPRSTHCISSAASDVYKRQVHGIKSKCEAFIEIKSGGAPRHTGVFLVRKGFHFIHTNAYRRFFLQCTFQFGKFIFAQKRLSLINKENRQLHLIIFMVQIYFILLFYWEKQKIIRLFATLRMHYSVQQMKSQTIKIYEYETIYDRIHDDAGNEHLHDGASLTKEGNTYKRKSRDNPYSAKFTFRFCSSRFFIRF
eukprot:TRINITY_DN32570_c0_g1_i2.p2 TRINITY_DN32570_c0_g1~~TRINITY_DN32570_c0_g1_i2.p2  ORF type:complete len:198 (-),score=15.74 TRINITY_DN32570_c0_g1_i2:104-697(-)